MIIDNGDPIHYKEAEFLEFARFCAMPRGDRDLQYGYSSFIAFAEKFGVSKETLSLWRRQEKFWKEVKLHRKDWFAERTPEVLLALYRTALRDGKANEVKAWFNLVEDWKEIIGIEDQGENKNKLHLYELLKNANDDTRKQFIDFLEKLDGPGNLGGGLQNGPAGNDKPGNLPDKPQSENLEAGPATPGVE